VIVRASSTALVGVVVAAAPAAADPTDRAGAGPAPTASRAPGEGAWIVGTAVHAGEALGQRADARVGTDLFVLAPIGGGWVVGGEIGGTFESHLGGYGCGMTGGDAVPSIAVTCMEPTLGAHVVVGVEAGPTARSVLRVEAGAGGSRRWLVAGDRAVDRAVAPSARLRVSYLVRGFAAPSLGATWWLGVAVEDRAIGATDARVTRAIGVVVEAR
jgi:hypothetical protein